MVVRIKEPELRQLHQNSLPLADGSGYLGTLAVYHELHCLKRLRKWIYKDTYYPHISSEDEIELYAHADHCLELLRQASVCRGDVSIIPYAWLRNHKKEIEGPTLQRGAPRLCVNWDALEGWAKDRKVDLRQEGVLNAP